MLSNAKHEEEKEREVALIWGVFFVLKLTHSFIFIFASFSHHQEEEDIKKGGDTKEKVSHEKSGSNDATMDVDNDDEDFDEDEIKRMVENDIKGRKDGNDSSDEEDGDWGAAMDLRNAGRRGLGGVIGMLKTTGELNKNTGKEELRGRAKDEKTYNDYDDLDLKSVVRIDRKTATDKDKLIANKQINLDYRDEHGRLLTR